jgi:flagellum-specific peptidoglycan hydrolase FlgJ
MHEDFMEMTYNAARKSGHIFPDYAACEAALESAYGTSRLAVEKRNLFAAKHHLHSEHGLAALPVREFLDGEWNAVTTSFIVYPDVKSCFADRMATLCGLASAYPHYAQALAAKDGMAFVRAVSESWCRDPRRAWRVRQIYSRYEDLLNPNPAGSKRRE